ncbi:DUF917 family protein [Anaerococcus porci]|uniref:S-methyl thiohydantoin desulfurase domain-containing protein n=1 Tax=Anaerococcus porci TaxID=2652269 RepID=UPI002A761F9B|nr:DUF917 family protein [Anaerococcus porci]MDY3007271.1 DUF917 family protein [Anaerococcus porci]
MKKLNEIDVEKAIIGGSVLGGGGGGSKVQGKKIGLLALEKGEVRLSDINEFDDEDIIVCTSLVGAPSSKEQYVSQDDYLYTISKMSEELGKDIKGVITIENGGGATVNGWMQSVISNVPVVDAPANGRAHPTGIMGSLNLHKVEGYESIQVYAGGNPEKKMNIRGVVRGDINNCAKLVREAAVHAGGLVVVARNSVKASYLKKNGAIGAISKALSLGEKMLEVKETNGNPIETAVEFLGGEIITEGKIENFKLDMKEGFDIGSFNVGDYQLTFWNEYMTIDKKEKRLYSFPDLIMTFNKKNYDTVTTAEVEENMKVVIIGVKADKLILGSPMHERTLLDEVSKIIGKEI